MTVWMEPDAKRKESDATKTKRVVLEKGGRGEGEGRETSVAKKANAISGTTSKEVEVVDRKSNNNHNSAKLSANSREAAERYCTRPTNSGSRHTRRHDRKRNDNNCSSARRRI